MAKEDPRKNPPSGGSQKGGTEEENADESEKIGLPEFILMVLVAFSADLFEFVATFIEPIPVIGQIFLVIKWFVAICSWLTIQFWLIMRGARGAWFLGLALGDLVMNFLGLDGPFGKTFGVIITVWVTNHPQITEVAQLDKVIKGVDLAKGGVK